MKRIILIITVLSLLMSCGKKDGKQQLKKVTNEPTIVSPNHYGITYKRVSLNRIDLSNGYFIKSKNTKKGFIYYLYVDDAYVIDVYEYHNNISNVDDLINKLIGKYNETSIPFNFTKENP